MGQLPSQVNKEVSVYQNPHHHSHPRLAHLRDFVFSQGHILKQLATLRYGDFKEAVDTLNKVTCRLQSSGTRKSLVFSIVPGTDAVAVLWKPQVRVKCVKKVDDSGLIESTRVLSLKQFVQVYSSIMQQLGGSGGAGTERGNNNGGASTSSSTQDITEINDERGGSDIGWLEISAIFENVEENSLESFDEGECCICMEQRVDVMLQCSHTYCQICIDNWRLKHNTCPICMGEMGTSKDIWTMPDKPAADEVATYLMGIADNSEQQMEEHQTDEAPR